MHFRVDRSEVGFGVCSPSLSYPNLDWVLDLRPELLSFQMSGLVTGSYTPNKEACWRAEKGDLLHGLGHNMEKGTISTQPIFSHLQGTDRAMSLNRQRTGGRGREVCKLNSPCHKSQSQSLFFRGSGVVNQSNLAGDPSWGGSTVGGSFCPLSWRCYQFCLSWNPRKCKVLTKRMA
jgi:hypothetical protein